MDNPPDTDSLLVAGKANGVTSNRESASSSPETRAVRPLSLRRNFVWAFAGNAVYAASMWGILVLLAKLGSPAMVGQYALAVAVCAPIIIFFQLQLRALQVTDSRNEYLFAQYFGLRLVGMCVAVGLATVVGLVAYEPGIALLIFLVAVNQAVASCRDVFFGAMQRHERMDVLGIGQMISGVLNLAFLGGAIFLTRSLHIAILAAIITKVLMLVLYDRPYASWLLRAAAGGDPAAASLRPSFSAREMWPLVKQAAPLGLMMMMSNAGTNVPRYFVEAAHGEAMLGYFAAVAALLQVGTLAVGALGQSASPRLAKYFQDNLGAFKRLLAKSCAVGAAVGVVGLMVALLASRPILELLFTPEYGEYGDILVVVMIAGGILYVSTFFGFALTAARYLKVQVPISVVILLVVLVSSWLLIGPYGLMGAALTLVAGAAARLVTQGGVVAYAIKKRQHQLRQT